MKQRGFLSIDAILVIVAVAAVAGIAWGLYHTGYKDAMAQVALNNEKERKDRQEMISGLALELADRSAKIAQARLDADRRVADERKLREGLLHAYVPQTADSASCIRAGFVRYTNAAAAGVPLNARPLPGTAEAPAGIGTDAVAGYVARNYDKYHDCKRTVAGILEEFDAKRQTTNTVVDRINQRVQRAERKVQ